MAAKFEIRSPKAGEYRWVLISQGRTLATGPAYARRAMAEKSIDSFRMAAIAAPVDDSTPTRAKNAPGKVTRVAGRAVGKAVVTSAQVVDKAEKAVAKGGRMEEINKGLAKLDNTVAEIEKVAKTAKRAAKKATKTTTSRRKTGRS